MKQLLFILLVANLSLLTPAKVCANFERIVSGNNEPDSKNLLFGIQDKIDKAFYLL